MLNTNSNTLSPVAAAVAVRNRLCRDLDELKRAAAGANTLPAADMSLDIAVSLDESIKALANAIESVNLYNVGARKAQAAAGAAEFNKEIFA